MGWQKLGGVRVICLLYRLSWQSPYIAFCGIVVDFHISRYVLALSCCLLWHCHGSPWHFHGLLCDFTNIRGLSEHCHGFSWYRLSSQCHKICHSICHENVPHRSPMQVPMTLLSCHAIDLPTVLHGSAMPVILLFTGIPWHPPWGCHGSH